MVDDDAPQRLVKIGAKIIRHGRSITFQMPLGVRCRRHDAEVLVVPAA